MAVGFAAPAIRAMTSAFKCDPRPAAPLVATLVLLFAANVATAATLATATVEIRDVESTYAADGVVEAIRESAVAAQVPGRIVELKANAGDAVAKGQVLARIDEREATQVVASSHAQVARAQAELANAKVNLDRAQKLVAERFVSQSAADKAKADYDAAVAALAAARAGAGQATTAKGYTVIAAPFTGVIADRHVNLGDMAQPGKLLFTIHDPKALRVVADVPEDVVGDINRTSVDSAVAEMPALGKTIHPKAVSVLPSADTRTHTKEVRLDLPENTQGVYPGMFARVHFATGRAKRLVIPMSAVAHRSEVAGAYVVGDNGDIRFRQLRLGERVGDKTIEVLAGLAPGERVALDPVAALAQLKSGSGKR